MPVYRVDVLVEDPNAVFQWQRENCPGDRIIRSLAYKTPRGWYIKTVFKRQEDAESFHRRWHPDLEDHTVPPFGGNQNGDSSDGLSECS
jgi:hypothetical protein